jgi:hypothetical protein
MATSIAVGIVKVLSNFGATSNPSASNDNTQGYAIGSVWINTTTDTAYRCFDASTGAAVWSEIGAGSGGGQTVVTPGSYPHTAANNTLILVDSSSARTINLPAPVANAHITIKDAGGLAATNNITIARNASEEIEGVAANYIVQADYDTVDLVSDGTDWFIVG